MDSNVKKCNKCGSEFKRILNEKYTKGSYEMKYINDDGKYRYFSNSVINRCPTCIILKNGV